MPASAPHLVLTAIPSADAAPLPREGTAPLGPQLAAAPLLVPAVGLVAGREVAAPVGAIFQASAIGGTAGLSHQYVVRIPHLVHL